MKAAILEGYNKNGTDLAVRDVPVPACGPEDVLVRVTAAGVNPLDNMIVRGEVKMIVPYSLPLVMGNELVGVVEAVGSNVTGFSVEDRVYARLPLAKIGAFAEYAAVDQAALAKVPDYLSDEEAACVPLTALTALQAFGLMQPKAGETVFISGGTGSLGAMAIPIAKKLGLIVATNGNAANGNRVIALGADRFFDYKAQDYASELSGIDYVLDTVGDRELAKEFSILKEGGVLVSLRGMPNGEFAARAGMPAYKRILFGLAGRKYDRMAAKKGQAYRFVFVHEDGRGLQKVSEMFGEKRIGASVDEVFEFADVNEALRKVGAGKSKGKTVLRISEAFPV